MRRLMLLFAILWVLPIAAQTDWEQDHANGTASFQAQRLDEAEGFFKQALANAEEFGEQDARLLASLKDLATLYRFRGRFAESEPLLRRAIELAEKDGRDHPEMAADLDLLARIYLAQMKLEEAEATFLREVALLENKYGQDALELIPALNNLFQVLRTYVTRADEAKNLLRHVISIREVRQGPEHPDVALELVRLGRLQAFLMEYGDAERGYRRALAIQEKAFGPEHLTLAVTLDWLGLLFRDVKRFTDAETCFRRSLALRENAYGPLNSEVAPALDSLAGILFLQERYAEAQPLFERALFIWTATLGPLHPLLPGAHDALARTLAYQQKYAEAEQHYRRALDNRESHILRSLNNTALIAAAQKNLKEAEPLYKAALALLERPREEPPDVGVYTDTLANYAGLLDQMGRKLEASKIEARADKLKKESQKKKPD